MIKKFAKSLMYKGSFYCTIYINFVKLYHLFSQKKWKSDKDYIMDQFIKARGYSFDLNNPITLNEKIQWLKLYDRSDLHTVCADKYEVRNYITNVIGSDHLIDLIYDTMDWNDVVIDNMPNFPFVIKPNHGSGWYHIVMDKNKANWTVIQNDCRFWLSQNYYDYQREWPYKNIKPRILVEKLLIKKDGIIPTNFRVHCIHGVVQLIALTIYNTNDTIQYKNQKYSRNWDLLNIDWAPRGSDLSAIQLIEPLPKPKNLNKLINYAEALSKPFKYVRIDFFDVDDILYNGEITFYDDGGYAEITPFEWDVKLGNLISL